MGAAARSPASPNRRSRHALSTQHASRRTRTVTWDAIVIGSGFGGAMAAHALVMAGQRVLMLERGGWVARGPQNWDASGVGLKTPHYTTETPYDVTSGTRRYRAGAWHCV